MAVTKPQSPVREPNAESAPAAPASSLVPARHLDLESLKGEGAEPLLVVRAGDLWLGLPAHVVDQLHPAPAMTPVPLAPAHVLGLAILRGEVIPVIDLERFLELDEAKASAGAAAQDQWPQSTAASRVAVISAGGMQAGLLCTEVRGIVPVRAPSQPGLKVARGRRLEKVASGEISTEQGVLVVLDPTRLLDEARVKP
jgi:purine-binding chemotaxis protein CheW